MRVHIVEPYHSFAMQRMSVPLLELSKLYEVTTGEEADHSADLNIHIPWRTMTERNGSKHIISYTHCNPPDTGKLYEACELADLVVCMSYAGRNELIQLGVDPKKLWVNYCAADNFAFKRKVIGIVGSVQPNGRKRESLLLDLAWAYDLSPFEFVFIGNGWEDTAQKLQSLGVACGIAKPDDAQLSKMYGVMDALLVTGYNEGGPLPLLEAMATGIKVISPRFGYAADLLNEHYDTPSELMDILNELAEPSILSHQIARAWSWSDYVAEYAMLIGRMFGSTAELFPAFAADRYGQILDIIDEIKPSEIVEIGTWNGNRALQMIQQAAKYHPIGEIYYQGFDLFETQTGEQFRSELSKRGWNVKVVEKRLQATGAEIELQEGDTKNTLKRFINKDADLYFVDGGHSEKTIQNDFEEVRPLLINSVAVFDDYYHEGKPEGMGCNKVIDSLTDQYKVTHLPIRTKTEDGRVIGMVRVEHA